MQTLKTLHLIPAALLLISCGAEDESSIELRIDKQCTLTACKAREQQCQANTTSRCDRCWDAASGLITSGGSFYDCTDTCDSSSCYRPCLESDTCQQYGFVVTLPEQRDEALFNACLQAEERYKRCGLPFGNCDTFARVERPEAADVYRCIAQTPCSKSTAGCNDLAAAGVAKRYCSTFQQICGASPQNCATPDQLDTDFFNWQRDQVNTEVLRCLEHSCSDAQQCINAYLAKLG